MKFKSIFIITTISIPLLLTISLIVGYCTNSYFDNRTGEIYQAIKINSSEEVVLEMLGDPDIVRPCGDNLWWDLEYIGKNEGDCITEVRYEYFLSAWSFGYSSDKKVISKYHYTSE
jgi:hypothetical protein